MHYSTMIFLPAYYSAQGKNSGPVSVSSKRDSATISEASLAAQHPVLLPGKKPPNQLVKKFRNNQQGSNRTPQDCALRKGWEYQK